VEKEDNEMDKKVKEQKISNTQDKIRMVFTQLGFEQQPAIERDHFKDLGNMNQMELLLRYARQYPRIIVDVVINR